MLKEEINLLPLTFYTGTIKVIDTKEKWEEVVQNISQESILGFDIEIKPTYLKGPLNPPALMQLATADTVYIIQFYKLRLVPSMLKILCDEHIIKAGVAIKDDMNALQRITRFKPAALVDLAHLAKEKGLKAAGLRTLCAQLLNYRISKTMQCSNWERIKLSPKQLVYAATDAWISRELYFKLQNISHKD